MSRQWARFVGDGHCGRCGKQMTDGDPVLLLTLPNVKRAFKYCGECEGPVPPDLPASERAPLQSRTKRMTPLSASMPRGLKRL